MKTNTKPRFTETTHEGGQAARMTARQALRRSVLSCMLFESEFYEEGEDIAARIVRLAGEVTDHDLEQLTIEARSQFNLRHVPLMLLSAAAKHKTLKAETVYATIQRADELAELLAIHAKINGVTPDKLKGIIPSQMKRGIAAAFTKFNEYSLAKYNRDGAVKLRDALFLSHAKPLDEAQAALWKRLIAGELAVPDTWEVSLSAGADKAETFTRLIKEGKLGYLALLCNLRNMMGEGVDPNLVKRAIIARENGADRVLPFRYVAAARACPQLEPAIDQALSECILASPVFDGTTAVLVDVSGSMEAKLSQRSDLTRMDAAAALACLIHGDRRVFSFSDKVVEVAPRNGMAGVDAILRSQTYSGTALFDAVAKVQTTIKHDRIIVITDEQAMGGSRFGGLSGSLKAMPAPIAKRAYVINVASAQNGVGYGPWTHIDGFSEAVLRYILELEKGAQ